VNASIWKLLGVLALAGGAARAFFAFATWRTSLRNRLLGTDLPRPQSRAVRVLHPERDQSDVTT
jgi:hypothetical protein